MDVPETQDDSGENEERPTVQRIATCRTPGCRSEGYSHLVTLEENVDGVLRAICGWCGNPPELTMPTGEAAPERGS
jgi:hypothetical protein